MNTDEKGRPLTYWGGLDKSKKQTAVEWLIEEMHKNIDWIPIPMQEQALEMEKEQMIAFGKRCFYKGFDKAENDDANCFTAWREEAEELITKQQEQ
jgi:hypothetical protein